MSIAALLLAWAMLAAFLYVTCDTIQDYFYNGAMPGLWWRVPLAGLPLAAGIVMYPCFMDVMFTDYLWASLGQPALWFLAMWLLCRFHPGHAAVVGITSFLLFGYLVTLALESLGLVGRA